jgi:subfamily B ATP-binding cassette protein MsbA
LNKLVIASCLFIPFIFLVRSVGGYFSSYWMSEVGMRATEGFRGCVFERLLQLPLQFFGKHASGDLLSRVLSDTGILQAGVIRTGGDLVKQPIVLISAVTFLVVEAFKNEGVFFALVGGISIPLLVFPIRTLGKRLKKKSAALQEKGGEMSGMASEVIQNPLEVRAYNLQGILGKSFDRIAAQRRRLELKMVRYRSILSPVVEVVAAIGFSFSLYLGARKGMELEDFMGMAMALFMAYEPVKKLGSLHGTIEQCKAAMARVDLILETDDQVPEPENPILPQNTRGEIIFENVRFGYGEEEVLKGVDVTIASSETIALVGESGGGKTTFANLIPRLYDVSSGRILVDGVDVKDFAKNELRNLIAIVPQMPVLFRGTIRENILMGHPDASQGEIEEAARKAYAHDFILRQENGYETEVSEKGSSLSGGQRQRIAIARAFLKDAPILILDEATSALDAESEAKVQSALGDLLKGRTTLIISHHESSRTIADRIFAFEKGVVRCPDEK